MSTHDYTRLNADDEDAETPTAPATPADRSRGILISNRLIWLVAFLLTILGVLQFGHWIPPGHTRDELSVNDTSSTEKETQQSEGMHGKLNVA
jgi:hypothetical protein